MAEGLTEALTKWFGAAMHLQAPWINELSEKLTVEQIKAAHKVLKLLRQKLGTSGS